MTGEGGRAGYAPHYAIPERNHRLGTGTGSLPPHEAPRFGRLRLPQLGAGVSRNGSVKRPSGRPPRAGAAAYTIVLRSLQPGHLTLVGIRTSGPYRVCAAFAARRPRAVRASRGGRRRRDGVIPRRRGLDLRTAGAYAQQASAQRPA